jgi:HlyD family secretion protein
MALASYFATPAILGPRIVVAPVTRGDVIRTVVASGRIQTPFRVDLGAQVTGTVADIPVSEGQVVRQGEVLIRLENSEAKANVELADAAVAQAAARLKQITEVTAPMAEETLRQAEANLYSAQRQYDRTEKLHAGGYSAQSQFDEARRAFDVAQALARAARVQAASSRPGGMDYVVAETALRQARASLQAAQAKLDYSLIRAPADGTLISRNVEKGDVVQPGKALMVLAPAGEIQVVVQVDEKNLGLVAVGQPALVSADAYPTERSAAEVVYINPAVDPQRASVEVKLRVLDPPDFLRQDMTVSTDIEVRRHADALLIPTSAVADANGTSPWVARIEDNRVEQRRVLLGLKGDKTVEILDGLGEGDLVAVSPLAAVGHRRVRPDRDG